LPVKIDLDYTAKAPYVNAYGQHGALLLNGRAKPYHPCLDLGKELDIFVDNKSATGKMRAYFCYRTTNIGSKKGFWGDFSGLLNVNC
jgi:hypothetical protein